MVSGEEFLTNAGNNLAMRMLIRWGGPMRGSYLGPYPTREAAFTGLRSAEGRIDAGLSPADFATRLGMPQPDENRFCQTRQLFEPDAALRHAALSDDIVVAGNEKYAVLFVKATGRPIAVYRNAVQETWGK